ncbi:MAG TPA: YHS domain-containing protein [Bacteroidota bacterium]|nr:YHS domain-containing protein [Bacteroidota bacterium]
MVKDLVCGMDVDESNPPFTSAYKGKIYYFCSHSCQREFERNPEKYLK